MATKKAAKTTKGSTRGKKLSRGKKMNDVKPLAVYVKYGDVGGEVSQSNPSFAMLAPGTQKIPGS